MTLGEVLSSGKVIGCLCAECFARTPLDPHFFLLRRGDVEIDRLRNRVVCGACGSGDIDLVAVKPEDFSYAHRHHSQAFEGRIGRDTGPVA